MSTDRDDGIGGKHAEKNVLNNAVACDGANNADNANNSIQAKLSRIRQPQVGDSSQSMRVDYSGE